jgi:hypothetical protein
MARYVTTDGDATLKISELVHTRGDETHFISVYMYLSRQSEFCQARPLEETNNHGARHPSQHVTETRL